MKRYAIDKYTPYWESENGEWVKYEDVKEMHEVLTELADLMQGVIDGEYKPDSFTLQPARLIIDAGEGGE